MYTYTYICVCVCVTFCYVRFQLLHTKYAPLKQVAFSGCYPTFHSAATPHETEAVPFKTLS